MNNKEANVAEESIVEEQSMKGINFLDKSLMECIELIAEYDASKMELKLPLSETQTMVVNIEIKIVEE
ncbi:MAG: hypothetical protein ACFNVI_00065 [Lachnoanaerobaculum gingivalis]|jgi:hypothetical protein